jgi:hypothetical protein
VVRTVAPADTGRGAPPRGTLSLPATRPLTQTQTPRCDAAGITSTARPATRFGRAVASCAGTPRRRTRSRPRPTTATQPSRPGTRTLVHRRRLLVTTPRTKPRPVSPPASPAHRRALARQPPELHLIRAQRMPIGPGACRRRRRRLHELRVTALVHSAPRAPSRRTPGTPAPPRPPPARSVRAGDRSNRRPAAAASTKPSPPLPGRRYRSADPSAAVTPGDAAGITGSAP